MRCRGSVSTSSPLSRLARHQTLFRLGGMAVWAHTWCRPAKWRNSRCYTHHSDWLFARWDPCSWCCPSEECGRAVNYRRRAACQSYLFPRQTNHPDCHRWRPSRSPIANEGSPGCNHLDYRLSVLETDLTLGWQASQILPPSLYDKPWCNIFVSTSYSLCHCRPGRIHEGNQSSPATLQCTWESSLDGKICGTDCCPWN